MQFASMHVIKMKTHFTLAVVFGHILIKQKYSGCLKARFYIGISYDYRGV